MDISLNIFYKYIVQAINLFVIYGHICMSKAWTIKWLDNMAKLRHDTIEFKAFTQVCKVDSSSFT